MAIGKEGFDANHHGRGNAGIPGAATVWELSDKEREIIRQLSGGNT